MKKSVSESHVTQIGNTLSATPSTDLYSKTNSIDELKEKEFHEQCDERSERRLPTTQNEPPKSVSTNELEDSSLLNKPAASEETVDETKPPQA